MWAKLSTPQTLDRRYMYSNLRDTTWKTPVSEEYTVKGERG